jgi:hypothetical protein
MHDIILLQDAGQKEPAAASSQPVHAKGINCEVSCEVLSVRWIKHIFEQEYFPLIMGL